MNVAFLIRSLEAGGAERQLVVLANGLAARGHQVTIAVFYGGGALEQSLCGVRLVDLQKRGRWDIPGFLLRLSGLLRTLRPDVLHGYLGTANILSVLLKPLMRGTASVWGVRSSDMNLDQYDWLCRWSFALERLLSRFADTIIVNSQSGYEYAVESGFAQKNMTVVPNGMDTDIFRPDETAGAKMRQHWSIPASAVVVGIPARLDPVKDHGTFLRACAALSQDGRDYRFVCMGDGPGQGKAALEDLAADLGIGKQLVWAGMVRDMAAAYNALDLCCLTSTSEGFPNVLAEAMACGVPCVSTDVGDARRIVHDFGTVVPVKSPDLLAAAMREALKAKHRPDQLREHVQEHFSVEAMLDRTETLLQESRP